MLQTHKQKIQLENKRQTQNKSLKILWNKMHKRIKQNPQTNQMKPKQIKWNPNKPTAKGTHATLPRERSQEEKRVWEREKKRFWPMMADREVRDGDSGNQFSERRRRRWEAAVAAWCWEWAWSFFQFRDFLLFEVSDYFCFLFFIFYFFIYTKPGAAFYKTQLRMNWSCVLLTVAL